MWTGAGILDYTRLEHPVTSFKIPNVAIFIFHVIDHHIQVGVGDPFSPATQETRVQSPVGESETKIFQNYFVKQFFWARLC